MHESRGDEIRFRVSEITPEIARGWLNVSPQASTEAAARSIRAYSREMRQGRWALNGETIVFARGGKLLDGRKRLLACVESGCSFESIVVENVEEEEFKTIDAHRVRSASDVLFIRNERYPRVLSHALNALLRYYRLYHRPTGERSRVTPREALFVLDARPEIRESVTKTAGFTVWGGHTVAAVVHHLAARVDTVRADRFFDRVLHGPDTLGDSATLLRKAFQTSRRAGQEYMLALTIRAWNADYAHKPLKFLRWRREGVAPEAFPRVAGLPDGDGYDLTPGVPPERDTTTAADLQVSIEEITPFVAEEWFNNRAPNRKVVVAVVEKYARDMEAEHWGLNGQTIKISRSGRLIDGQHRCAASVKTGLPFRSIVVRGLPDEAFETLDSGAARSLGAVLSTRGEKSTYALAATLQKLWLYEQDLPTLHTLRGSHAELLQVLEAHPQIRRSVQFCVRHLRYVLPGALGATTHYLASQVDQERADSFVAKLGEGHELGRSSPILKLRALLIRGDRPLRELEKWALTIKALNAYFEEREPQILVWRPRNGEGFPRVLEDWAPQARSVDSTFRPSDRSVERARVDVDAVEGSSPPSAAAPKPRAAASSKPRKRSKLQPTSGQRSTTRVRYRAPEGDARPPPRPNA